MRHFQKRLSRMSLRFLKLEVTDLQLCFSSNSVKINIITFKENILKNFYLKLKKNIYNYLYYRWTDTIYGRINNLLENSNKLFNKFLNNLLFLNFKSIRILLNFLIYRIKKLIKLIKIKKFKVLYFFKIFFTNINLLCNLKNLKQFNLKQFNLEIIKISNQFLLERLFKNLFFNLNCNINFIILENNILNAHVIFQFINKQLSLYKSINFIMKVVYTELIKYKFYKGFKILLRGRFTRKERAFKRIWTFGKLPLSTVVSPVDYYSNFYISKFGIGSIRIWLFKF